ncbi:16S rRNA (guanine966-N2)-methyltransferase [Halopolyspora algeriensis]|uniref:16S rRNA (Guanine966-N2)-methyltransferase n=1 Tax=Halopolyspora algeriensis TaxID=1500506 RepID=A0A368VGU9_9ACTN|nr:16S rRNA (guanine966-N2)-methyltransferase [Halopolyspora algeriensis]TQM56528.1 16S rRNA (guanine966-N2)-methyltransferase [Halopolyspora algeriensis]
MEHVVFTRSWPGRPSGTRLREDGRVMRIVAGSLGGRRIEVPSRGTRPTRERVRESLFSALESALDLSGLRVLDLYAGSGALGIEALSRGAAQATFVESDRHAARLLRRNLEKLELRGMHIEQKPVATALAARPRHPYDLVLIDPPYAVDSASLNEEYGLLVANGWTGPESLVIVERPVQSDEPRWPESLVASRSKHYGDTVVYWAVHTAVAGGA